MEEDVAKPQYGGSATFCDYILEYQLEEMQPHQLVDFGAGGGKIGKIARQILPEAKIIAVEGFEKTARMLFTESLYDEVHSSLIQEWVFKDLNKYDAAIFGDVLEHLTPKEIHRVMRQCLKKFKHIIVICPLQDIFQDITYGNPLEIHQAYITHNFFDRYNLIEKHIVKGKDWTIMNVHILSERESVPIWRCMRWFMFDKTIIALQKFGHARSLADNLIRIYLNCMRWLRMWKT